MANASSEIQEILRMFACSESQPERSDTYARLLQHEEQLGDQTQAIQELCDHLPTFVNHILRDISSEDEEIAAQALKSLGFIVYHPTLVAAISVRLHYDSKRMELVTCVDLGVQGPCLSKG
eukprot:Gb_29908 [translate_table: standard]